MSTNDAYYIPHKAVWPIIGTAGLMITFIGFANYLNGNSMGPGIMLLNRTTDKIMAPTQT